MTSNLGSEEIAEHALQLRAEAERLLNHRLTNTSDEDQEPEHIEISRNFKDQVVCIKILAKDKIQLKHGSNNKITPYRYVRF